MNERLGNRTSLFRDFTRRLVKSWSAKLGLYLFLAIVLICFIGPFFCRYGKNDIDITAINAAPSREHLLGCDTLGRDMLVRLLYGGQYSIVLGLVAALFGNFVGLARNIDQFRVEDFAAGRRNLNPRLDAPAEQHVRRRLRRRRRAASRRKAASHSAPFRIS